MATSPAAGQLTFMLVAWDRVSWPAAGLVAVGALAGGYLGSTVGRRLPPLALRAFIIVIGVVAIIKMVWFT